MVFGIIIFSYIYFFDIERDNVSIIVVNGYKILSNMGIISVNIVMGSSIILIIGTKKIFNIILIIFIS
ncbi:MAG: hypothetical protein L6V91_09410 [Bacilli bacterium]|nr:MAG: hypothetical protein L6V91_09410 [Bacilli bacterium]